MSIGKDKVEWGKRKFSTQFKQLFPENRHIPFPEKYDEDWRIDLPKYNID